MLHPRYRYGKYSSVASAMRGAKNSGAGKRTPHQAPRNVVFIKGIDQIFVPVFKLTLSGHQESITLMPSSIADMAHKIAPPNSHSVGEIGMSDECPFSVLQLILFFTLNILCLAGKLENSHVKRKKELLG